MKNKNRYRLIKEYPNSPELGTTISYSGEYNQYYCDYSIPVRDVNNINPHEYPEFWEEIEVKQISPENQAIESKAKKFMTACGTKSMSDTYTAYIVEKMLIEFGKELLKNRVREV